MPDNEIHEMLDLLFRQAQMQFGRALKGRWFHDSTDCPGCHKPIKSFKFKKKDALSLNSFFFREHGVLIAYLLCGKCARYIIRQSELNPYGGKFPLHGEIEKTLKQAFIKQLGH